MQEQDNPADFRWRCIHSDNPAANRLAAPDCRELSTVRATKSTAEEKAFAHDGRKAPEFVVPPKDIQIIEGQEALFQARAEGIPNPSYQWYVVDRSNEGKAIEGETNSQLTIKNAGRGVTHYVLRAWNSAGETVSSRVTLAVEIKAEPLSRPATLVRPRIVADPQLRSWENPDTPLIPKRRFANSLIVPLAIAMVGIIVAAIVFFRGKWFGPTIVNQPTAQTTIPSSGRCNLSVSASSSLPLNYQWQLNGANIDGETNISIYVSNAGTYSVIVRNVAAVVTSSNAVVNKNSAEPVATELSQSTGMGPPQTGNSSELRDTISQWPPGWTKITNGTVTHPSAEYIKEHFWFDLHATAADSSLEATNFFFVYTNNDTHEFRTLLTNWSVSGAAGILVRQSTSNDAPYLFIGVSNNQVQCWTYNGGKTTPYPMNKPSPSNVKGLTLCFGFSAGGNVTASWITPKGSTPVRTTKAISFPLTVSKPLAGYAIFPAGTNQTRAQFYPAE